MERTFTNALKVLRSRSRPRSTRVVDAGFPRVALPSGDLAGRGYPPVHRMRGWLRELGHSDDELARLKIIHVAGTKGKGSTCAFIESLLRAHGQRTGFPAKTGLYTSPHLVSVTERIRINFQPICEDIFARYAFEVYDALHLSNNVQGPGFLQLLALVSFHVFIREGVDVAIYETHHGGEFCATNVIERPVVTAITNIGMDHIVDLGPSLENIAWHKAGILKPGAPAFTSPQAQSVLAVLKQRALDKGVTLTVVEADETLPGAFSDPLQRLNCSVARAVSDTFLQQVKSFDQPRKLVHQDILNAIHQFYWPGRFERIESLGCSWFLDVAHNEMSIAHAARWFQRTSLDQSVIIPTSQSEP